jgi:hypothetical protein
MSMIQSMSVGMYFMRLEFIGKYIGIGMIFYYYDVLNLV